MLVEKPVSDEEPPTPQPDTLQLNKIDLKTAVSTYQSGSFRFSIYLGSFISKERAEKAITQYTQKGLSPFWVKVNLIDKGIWYRLYTGYFNEYEEAQSFIQENQLADAEIKKTAYGNFIGSYKTSDDAETMMETIKDLGYSPYEIKDQNTNISFLFVGAFMTKEGAEEQNNELLSNGIHSQVVKR